MNAEQPQPQGPSPTLSVEAWRLWLCPQMQGVASR